MDETVSRRSDYDLDYILGNLSDLTSIASQHSSPQAAPQGNPLTPIQELYQPLSSLPVTPTRPPQPRNTYLGTHPRDASPSDSESDPMDGIDSTSSLRHGGRTAKQGRVAKGQKKRLRTMAARRTIRDAIQTQILLTAAHENEAINEAPRPRDLCEHETYFQWLLDDLGRHNVTWGDFVEWIAQPVSRRRNDLWHGFFIDRGQVNRVLNLWATKNSSSAKNTMREWALAHLGDVLGREGDRVTKDGPLLTQRMPVDESFVTGFEMRALHSHLSTLCPSMTALMRQFCTTRVHARLEAKENKTPREQAIVKRRHARRDLVSNLPIIRQYELLIRLEARWDRAGRPAWAT